MALSRVFRTRSAVLRTAVPCRRTFASVPPGLFSGRVCASTGPTFPRCTACRLPVPALVPDAWAQRAVRHVSTLSSTGVHACVSAERLGGRDSSGSSGSSSDSSGDSSSGLSQHRVALYAGSFDPPSEGHLDIINRALQLCDELIVSIAVNPDKKCLFSIDERQALVKRMCEAELGTDARRVRVVSFDGLVVEFAKENDVNFLVRGLRAFSDFEYEFRMALINRKLTGIETSFLMADERMSFVSSSLIREVAVWGKMLPHYVPKSIEDPVFERLRVPPGAADDAAAVVERANARRAERRSGKRYRHDSDSDDDRQG